MSISVAHSERKTIRKRVRCGVHGCTTIIGHHIWKSGGLKKYDNGFVFVPSEHHAGGRQVICKSHGGKER